MSSETSHSDDHLDLLNGRGGISRRGFLQLAATSLCLSVVRPSRAAAPGVVAVRVWPSADYTRVTLESTAPIVFKHFVVDNPDRLVVDLQGVEYNGVLQAVSSKVMADDPYLKALRVGRNTPSVVRLVFDLREPVNTEVFALPPVGEYGHRLVVDLKSRAPRDPLMALVDDKQAASAAVAKPAASEPVAQPAPADKPSSEPASTGSKRARSVVVTLDPGHGGEDPGAIGASGNYEKTVVLAVGKQLKRKLEAEGCKVMLTRDGDYFVPLGERVARARAVKSDLFVSIHADAAERRDARGSSVFMLSNKGSSSVFARWLAKTQNDADLIGGIKVGTRDPYLAHMLLDLTTTATREDSKKLGRSVLSEMASINRLHSPRVEEAGFAVLKAPDIPSILVETAFISNPEEEQRLVDDSYRDKLTDALASGIRNFLAKSSTVRRA